jgi:hypothetical protein
MDYWVYENWTIDKAVVHEAACRFCNDGRGIHRADEGHNGLWHGPFNERTTGDAWSGLAAVSTPGHRRST